MELLELKVKGPRKFRSGVMTLNGADIVTFTPSPAPQGTFPFAWPSMSTHVNVASERCGMSAFCFATTAAVSAVVPSGAPE